MKKLLTSFTDMVQDAVAMIYSPKNRWIAAVWALCLIGVIGMGLYLQSKSASFLGIAESREVVINFDHPVVIARIRVAPGQSVAKGDLIAEVDQPELDLKIQEIRTQMAKLQAEMRLRLEMAKLSYGVRASLPASKLDLSSDPLGTEIRGLQQELAVLESRERGLYVFAEISGIVGSVNFKKGETVAPYAPLLTISPAMPTFVEGFVYESLQTRFNIGQKVRVYSVADPSRSVEGRVMGLGSRIVELPVRLVRMQTHKLWGREVTVEIPADANPFLLGEKVQVEPRFAFLSLPMAQAEDVTVRTASAKKLELHQVAIPESMRLKSAFEPSGAVYLKDLHKFAVVSDDTDEDETAYVMLLNPDGSLDANPVRIEGLDRMQDLESISQDAHGDLYLMSSLSRSGKGKVKRDRGLFARVKRRGLQFVSVGVVSLRDLLVGLARENRLSEDIRHLAADFDRDLSVEGHLVNDDGDLLIAIKRPLDELGRNTILNLGSAAKIVSENKIDAAKVKIFATLEFPNLGQRDTQLVEMIPVGKSILLGTVSREPGRTGRVFRYEPAVGRLTMLAEFQEHIPEGLGYDTSTKELMMLFDEAAENALFVKMPNVDGN